MIYPPPPSLPSLCNTHSGIARNLRPDVIAGQSYRAIWSQQNRNQRDFQSYGGDFLMEQHVDILRGFFQAFFSLDEAVWGGFLAGWPGLPGNIHHESWNRRLVFALSLFLKMNNKVPLTLMIDHIAICHQIHHRIVLVTQSIYLLTHLNTP